MGSTRRKVRLVYGIDELCAWIAKSLTQANLWVMTNKLACDHILVPIIYVEYSLLRNYYRLIVRSSEVWKCDTIKKKKKKWKCDWGDHTIKMVHHDIYQSEVWKCD